VPGRALRATAHQVGASVRNSAAGQIVGATADFVSNYNAMRDANTIGADKYFHAKANCQAAQRGSAGEGTAEVISDVRELVDQKVKGDPESASHDDQEANRAGRAAGAAAPTGACSSMVEVFRPNGLNAEY
jgi:hypothetical protein